MNKEMYLESSVLFIFGATGDLAKRKLFPAIFSLFQEKKLAKPFAVIGLARRPRTNEQFRADIRDSIQNFARYKVDDEENWQEFASHFHYQSLDIHNVEGFTSLCRLSEQLEQQYAIKGNRLFYLALAPELFGSVSHNIKAGGLLESNGWHRLVIEKPFGYDLPSAEKLNSQINEVFEEKEIFRIDHYLGKEMVQNIEVIRFANVFFEPLWNRTYISNIQITASETVGVEDRGGYYDRAGALRDMGQNHILQMLSMMAMEPPSRLAAEDIRDEKVKVLRSLRLYEDAEDVKQHVVRGQYSQGQHQGKELKGYRTEENVQADSTNETYFAATIFVDNYRWAGVPFYVRTGKRLPAKSTEVVVEFKTIPDKVHFAARQQLEPNLLVFRVNPMEGIYVQFNAKNPNGQGTIVPLAMDFCQTCDVGINSPEAYERLLFDVIRGESTYFTRWDEVSLAWSFVDRIEQAWKEHKDDLQFYPAGSWGPEKANKLLAERGHKWWPVQGQHAGEINWVAPTTREEKG